MQTPFRALDFITQSELASHANTAGTNSSNRAIFKMDEEFCDIFVFNSTLLGAGQSTRRVARASGRDCSLPDSRGIQPTNLSNIANQKLRECDSMRTQITQ